jgi:hypothetical protein
MAGSPQSYLNLNYDHAALIQRIAVFRVFYKACEESMSVLIAEISGRKTFVVNALRAMIFMPVHSLYINSE